MTTRLLGATLVALFMAPLAAHAQAPAAAKPNVVLIITDDVGYGDIGSYGAPDIKTPNIDRLAREGMRLTDFYAAPTCSPTRAALITRPLPATIAHRAPAGRPHAADGSRACRRPGRSLPQLLKNNGYATGLVGKWHLGYKPEFSPNAHGFDYFFGFKSGLIDYYQHTDQTTASTICSRTTSRSHVDGYMTDLITERSVKFIETDAGRPFFLEVAYNAAHWPFQVPDQPSVAPDNARFVQPQDDRRPARARTTSRSSSAPIRASARSSRRSIGSGLDAQHAGDLHATTTAASGCRATRRCSTARTRCGKAASACRRSVRWPGRIPAGKTSAQVGITMDLTAIDPRAATGVRRCRSPTPKASREVRTLLRRRCDAVQQRGSRSSATSVLPDTRCPDLARNARVTWPWLTPGKRDSTPDRRPNS